MEGDAAHVGVDEAQSVFILPVWQKDIYRKSTLFGQQSSRNVSVHEDGTIVSNK